MRTNTVQVTAEFIESSSHLCFRQYINDPEGMNSAVASYAVKRSIAESMLAASRDPPGTGHTKWAMFSLEHLSGCCPERVLYNQVPVIDFVVRGRPLDLKRHVVLLTGLLCGIGY